MEKMTQHDLIFLRSLILMVALYAAIALLGAVFGVFYTPYVWLLWGLLCVLFTFKKIITFPRPSQEFLLYGSIALAFALVIAFFTVPTVFSGRDQGSLATAAMQLHTQHGLITHLPESTAFFEIYGYGKALNFPGFFYTADGGLLTQFPLPYITFLAGFFGVFGMVGFTVANCLLLTVTILSLACIARSYVRTRYTLVFLLLLLTAFPIGWFAKFTLSENLASMLVWSAAVLYLALKEHPNRTTYATLFIVLALLLFARLEGVWFFVVFLILLVRNSTTRTLIKKDVWWHAILPLTVLFTVSCVVAVMNMPFIHTMFSVFAKTAGSAGNAASTFIEEITHLFSIYALYGLLGPLVVTALLCATALRYKNYRSLLLPIAITFPLFSYYLFPHISGDHPWMLRRFVFALLPATLLVSTFFIANIPKKWPLHRPLQSLIIVLLLLMNLPAFTTFLPYAENPTLHDQVHQFAQQFSARDLILVDRDAAGSGWSMIPSALRSLENKHAVYFFNPSDYHQLNTSGFDHVYLVVPNDNKARYLAELSPYMHYVNKYTFTTDQLTLESSPTGPMTFPRIQHGVVRGTIYELR
jgi:hypothetical protein